MTVALALSLSVEGAEPSGVNLSHVMVVKGHPGFIIHSLNTEWRQSSEISLLSSILTFSPVFSSSLPLLVDEGVSSPSRDTRTKSSLLRVDTESDDTLIFPTEPLSSMAAAVQLSRAAHEWETGGGGGGR